MQRKILSGMFCVFTLAGCGAVYIPNEVKQRGYGYHNTNYGDVEVLPLTFSSAQDANSDGYVTRPLPDVFAKDAFTSARRISVRDRLREEGLDVIEPPFVAQSDEPRLDPDQEILPPLFASENRSPSPVVSVVGGNVDTRINENDGAPPFRNIAPPPLRELTPLLDEEDDFSYLPERARTGEGLPDAPDYGATGPQEVALSPPPDIRPEPYRIGTGDVIGLISNLQPVGIDGGAAPAELSGTTKRLRVEGNGRIFLPQAGSVAVGGKTLAEARQAIFDRLVENDLDFDFGVEVLEFGSQKVAISGPSGAQLLPIDLRPLRLGEAIAAAGGLGTDPDNAVVRILRDGSIYEVPGRDLATSATLSDRVLLDGDAVYISPIYELDRALGYFNQQLQLRGLRQTELDQEFEREKFAYEREQALREQRRQAYERAIARDALEYNLEVQKYEREVQAYDREVREFDQELQALARERSRIQFDIAMENYRLEAERLRQQATASRLEAQRAADDANDAARRSNRDARQAYIDRLRSIRDANRALDDRRIQDQRANSAERARNRSERRALLELEIAEEQDRLDRLVADRERARTAFSARAQFDAIERDYVFVSGETRTTELEMPLGRTISLARVLFGTGGGVNTTTGDPSEIYVIRRRAQGSVEEPLVIYHLDARDAARYAVATAMEMRPNDIVFVNPQAVTNWNRTLSQIIPSTSFLFGTIGSVSGLPGLGGN